jgi:hypothetical protein
MVSLQLIAMLLPPAKTTGERCEDAPVQAMGAARYRSTGMAVAFVFFANVGVTISFQLNRISS